MTTTERQVYLVDDEAAVRRSIAFMLRTAGYAIESFESGEAFLRAAPGLPMGCVLLDIRMPGMDGLQVQAAMRGLAQLQLAVDGNDPLAHAGQAIAFTQGSTQASVIVDIEQDLIATMMQGHGQGLCVGMPCGVGHRFLHDAQDGFCNQRIGNAYLFVDVQLQQGSWHRGCQCTQGGLHVQPA